jgi:hypothetical protein
MHTDTTAKRRLDENDAVFLPHNPLVGDHSLPCPRESAQVFSPAMIASRSTAASLSHKDHRRPMIFIRIATTSTTTFA